MKTGSGWSACSIVFVFAIVILIALVIIGVMSIINWAFIPPIPNNTQLVSIKSCQVNYSPTDSAESGHTSGLVPAKPTGHIIEGEKVIVTSEGRPNNDPWYFSREIFGTDWVRIKYGNSQYGWIHADCLTK